MLFKLANGRPDNLPIAKNEAILNTRKEAILAGF